MFMFQLTGFDISRLLDLKFESNINLNSLTGGANLAAANLAAKREKKLI